MFNSEYFKYDFKFYASNNTSKKKLVKGFVKFDKGFLIFSYKFSKFFSRF